ncbi:MAG TPA: hypothetical protein DCW39_08130 [Betaproteobacteria bacterium]|jgi:hypothetical protein|nr:hypothetical protein [Betaproteobacteria bacterium]
MGKTTPVSVSRIVIRASNSSWVEVFDPSTGGAIFTNMLRSGAAVDVPDINGQLLDTGNAGALKITVDGMVFPKIGSIGDVRKSVSLMRLA